MIERQSRPAMEAGSTSDQTDAEMGHRPTMDHKKNSRSHKRYCRAVTLAAWALLMSWAIASPANAAFGDGFGFSPVNDGAGSAQEAPAFPDADDPGTVPNEADGAFWAGTCDRATAPAFGSPIPGGIGTYPGTVFSPGLDPIFSIPTHLSVAAPASTAHCVEWGVPSDSGPLPWSQPPSWRLAAHTQAGGHPDGTTGFAFNRLGSGSTVDGTVDNIVVNIPPGFVGDPTAVPKCTSEQFSATPLKCPPQTQVGVLHLEIQAVLGAANVPSGNERIYPLYNLEPRHGNVAELGFGYASGEDAVAVRIVAKARTNSDFGVTAFVGQIPAALQVRSQQVTLWGVPWAATNDVWRAPQDLRPSSTAACTSQPGVFGTVLYIPPSGLTSPGCAQKYKPSWGPIKPFISNLTECTGGDLSTQIAMDSFQNPGAYDSEHDPILPSPVNNNLPGWKVYESPAPPITGCGDVPFQADLSLQSTSSTTDSASGLSVGLNVMQNNDALSDSLNPPAADADQATIDQYVADATAHWKSTDGLATSHLDKAVVTLPEGFSVNPSAAAGLEGCSDSGIGLRQEGNPPLFNNGDPFNGDATDGAECPLASIIGDVDVETPLLEEPLEGHVVLGNPKSTDPTSGQMFRMFIFVKDDDRGLLAKIYGSAVADPNTGKLTATFDKNPRVPFEDMHIEFKRGDRGILGTPQKCAANNWSTVFTPWTAAHGAGGQSVADGGSMATDQGCNSGFAPTLQAGMDNQQAGGSGKFAFRFSRTDGQQWLRGLTAQLPQGLLGAVRDVPLCSDANAAAGTCGPESRIGSLDAGAGSGNPFFLEKKGDVYLTTGYKGGAYGLSVRVPVEAGPFRGQFALSPIVVRQALYVDPTDAHVTAVSDPFPLIHHGIPLRVREATVTVDRPGFLRQPTDCSEKQIKAQFTSAEGAQSSATQRFQTAGCAGLKFEPKLSLALTGKRQVTTSKHPGIKAVVTQTPGEAGVDGAQVRLPLSLALDPENAQALCEFTDGTKDDPENHCPAGSIVGRARAVSPLLRQPLSGNVYFVKNVRIDPVTGNQIRTLPMIIVALRGEIAVNLRGVSSTTKAGKLVNTFSTVPDAPVQQFNLNIAGGKNGILAVTRTRKVRRINVCDSKQIAEADFDGQNGKRFDRDIRMTTPCAKKSKAKSQAKRKTASRRKR